MEKRWNIQFPISFFSFLCPSSTGDSGISFTDRMLLPLPQRRNYSYPKLLGKTLSKHKALFLLFQSHKITLLFPFSFQSMNCYGSLSSPKCLNGSIFYRKMCSLMIPLTESTYMLLDNAFQRNYIMVQLS